MWQICFTLDFIYSLEVVAIHEQCVVNNLDICIIP